MSDGDLLVFGCAVLFIAYAGAYVFLRERYTAAASAESRRAVRAEHSGRSSRRVA